MKGTYNIVKTVSRPDKFACYVKFNEEIDPEFYSNVENYPEGGEYFEVESLSAEEIAATLQEVADNDLARNRSEDAVRKQVEEIEIVDGQILI